jgi:WASH complex subunit strumpellin
MKETNIGHLRMNPQELLEEGLRKELVLQISIALHKYLRFTMKRGSPISDRKNLFMTRIIQLAKRMDGFQMAIVWLQDYLKIDGLNIYFQELSRVIWQNTK